MEFDVDFVVTWVDGNDPKWTAKRKKYMPETEDNFDSDIRFRDYGTFKYWFRSVEKYTPWVRKIFLVTDDQIPVWLGLNPKLVIVDHKDIIDNDALPTYNSNAIEMNIANIDGLAEHFVLFNDDTFVNRKMSKKEFFSDTGLPKDYAVQNAIMPLEDFDHIWVNNLKLINQSFEKYSVIKHNVRKFFNYRYGMLNVLSFFLLPWPRFTRFMDPHLPASLLKSSFDITKNQFPEAYKKTTFNRFRDITDNSFWLIRYFQLVTGNFSPRSPRIGKMYNLNDIEAIQKDIERGKHKLICINDADLSDSDFKRYKKLLQASFEVNLSSKSSFEKDVV